MTRDDFFAYLAAFQRADFEGFSKYYVDDVRLSLAGGAKVMNSRAEIVAFYKEVLKRVRETLEVTYLVIDEHALAAEIKTEFTALEDWPDFMVRPLRKGESARIISFAHYTLRDGKFSEIRSCRYGMW
jgi:hypothetical protein